MNLWVVESVAHASNFKTIFYDRQLCLKVAAEPAGSEWLLSFADQFLVMGEDVMGEDVMGEGVEGRV